MLHPAHTFTVGLEPYGPEHEALRDRAETDPVDPYVARHWVTAIRRQDGTLAGWAALYPCDGVFHLAAAAHGPWVTLRLLEAIDREAMARGFPDRGIGFLARAATPQVARALSRLPGWVEVDGELGPRTFMRRYDDMLVRPIDGRAANDDL